MKVPGNVRLWKDAPDMAPFTQWDASNRGPFSVDCIRMSVTAFSGHGLERRGGGIGPRQEVLDLPVEPLTIWVTTSAR